MSTQNSSVKKSPIAWWAILVEGVFAIFLGVLLLFFPQVTPVILAQFLALYLMVKGIVYLASIFTNPRSWFLKLILGLLGLTAGVLILNHPFWGGLNSGMLVFIISGIAILVGLIAIIQSLLGGGLSSAFQGMIMIMIGVLLFWQPIGSYLELPVTIGLLLITSGFISIIKSLSLFFALPSPSEPMVEPAIEPLEDTSPVRTAAVVASVSEYAYSETVLPEGSAIVAEPVIEEEAAGSELDWAIAESTPEVGKTDLSVGELAAAAAIMSAIPGDEEQEPASESALQGDLEDIPEVAAPAMAASAVAAVAVVEAVREDTGDDSQDNLVLEDQIVGEASEPTGLVESVAPEIGSPVEQVEESVQEDQIVVEDSVKITPVQAVEFELGDEQKRYLNQEISYIEGIGPVYAEKLKSVGVLTALDLLKSGATRKGRSEIVEETGISQKLVLRWVNQADLYRVKGIGSEYAELLEAAGVDTVVELSGRKAENLHLAMLNVNQDKKLVRQAPSLNQVIGWIEHARQLPRIIRY